MLASKTLHIIRHAKSSWKDPDLADVDRPLNKRGKGDRGLMAQPIWDHGCDFSNVFCSPAKRARRTIAGIYKALPQKLPPWQIDDALYTFEYLALISWCRALDDQLEAVVIVGHNPALTELCRYLIPNCGIENVPTCGYVQIQLAVNSWRKIEKGCGKQVCFIKPKDFI